MTPSNPSNGNPYIIKIKDSNNVEHQVAPVIHTHSKSEVAGLEASLSMLGYEISKSEGNQLSRVKCKTDNSGNVQIEFLISNLEELYPERTAVVTWQNISNLQRALSDPDTTPTANSGNLVTSGGVKTALDAKQDALTFDTTPTADSTNPVTSGGVKAALDGKQDALTFDTTPTANSSNPVTSGGVKAAIGAAIEEAIGAAIEEATGVIISDNPLDMSTFEKKRVYTAILTNTTGDPIKASEYLDVNSLPSDEQNIIFNSSMIDVPDGEEFGIRFIRTDKGVYAFFDGILVYQ